MPEETHPLTNSSPVQTQIPDNHTSEISDNDLRTRIIQPFINGTNFKNHFDNYGNIQLYPTTTDSHICVGFLCNSATRTKPARVGMILKYKNGSGKLNPQVLIDHFRKYIDHFRKYINPNDFDFCKISGNGTTDEKVKKTAIICRIAPTNNDGNIGYMSLEELSEHIQQHKQDWLKIYEQMKQQLEPLEAFITQHEGNATPSNKETSPMQDEITSLLLANHQVILTGAPGTGKTYLARKIAKELAQQDEESVRTVQFHPSYDYSDFVIGLKPVLVDENGTVVEDTDEEGNVVENPTKHTGKVTVSFQWKDGVFKKFADDAKKALKGNNSGDPPKFVMVIDEINRADLSRVFGELFSLLESEYRYDGKDETHSITLPNGENFVIPSNLYIIGTMNDIDRSVESMDFALRRRFAWKEVTAKDSEHIIEDKCPVNAKDPRKIEALVNVMKAINKQIENSETRLGTEYQLGGAIFANFWKYTNEENPFDLLWENHISIILSEYLRGNIKKRDLLREFETICTGKKLSDGASGNANGSQSEQSKTPPTEN